MKEAYVNFLTHCYIDTEVEMKEIYTSHHMWQLFESSFLLDMGIVSNATHDRKHADQVRVDLLRPVTNSVRSLYVVVVLAGARTLRNGHCHGHSDHLLQESIFGSEHNGAGKIADSNESDQAKRKIPVLLRLCSTAYMSIF